MDKVKILLIGNDEVGKTSLNYYLTYKKFNRIYNRTIGIDLNIKNFYINGKHVQLHIYDSSGSKRYRHISEIYIKTITVIILVYSITDKQSFIDLENWINIIKNINPECLNNLIIIGNKSDQIPFREISYELGKKFANKYNANFFECSTITGTNIELAFKTAAEKAINSNIKKLNDDIIEFNILNDEDEIKNNVSCWFNFIKLFKNFFNV